MAGVAGRARGDLFRRALRDDVTAFIAGFRAEINDPIGAFDDIQIVLDDDDRVPGVYQALENLEQHTNVIEMQTRGRFVEKK